MCTGTDPKGWKTTYGYDGRGNLISVTPANTALLGARSLSYDGFGRVTSVTDGRGQTLTYTWDKRDHLTGIAGAATVAYAWDGDGNQTANQGAVIGYDLQNRAKSLTIGGKSTSVSFDKVGNIASFTDENGKTTTYSYFWHHRVASIGVDGAACNWGRETSPQTMPTATPVSGAGCVKFRYDNNGNETARALPGGVTQSKAYDASGRMTAVSSAKAGVSGLLTSQGYTYTTPAGADRTSVQSWITGAATQSPGPVTMATQAYGYDGLDRLTGVVEKSGSATVASWAYGYDGMGNRTSQTRTGTTGTTTGVETATYNAASQLTSNSYGSFTYDKNGNEITAPGLPAAGVPARAGVVTDPLGNATSMTIAGATQPYSYGGTSPGMYNQLFTGGGTTYSRSILGLALANSTTGGTSVRYLTHPNGTPAGYIAPEGQAWLLTDRLGSIIGLVDGVSGTLIGRYSYDPYGLPRGTDETNTLAGRNIHRFHGGIFDKTTKLTRFGVRCGGTSRLRGSDPTTGRFTTPDPTGKEKHPYLYVSGNPCNRTDPTGETDWVRCIGSGIGVLSGVFGKGMGLAGIVAAVGGAPATVGTSTLALPGAIATLGAGLVSTAASLDAMSSVCPRDA